MMLKGDREAGAALLSFDGHMPRYPAKLKYKSFQPQYLFDEGVKMFMFGMNDDGWLRDIEFLSPTLELPMSLVDVVWDGVDHDGSVGLALPLSQRRVPDRPLMELRVDPRSERCYVSLGSPTPSDLPDHGVRRLRPEPASVARFGQDIVIDVDCERRMVGVELANCSTSMPQGELERARVLHDGEVLRPWDNSTDA